MSEFIFIRHGQTDANANGQMCGRAWNLPLSPLGEEQAKGVANQFSHRLDAIQKIYVSTMLRARQTADLVFPRSDAQRFEFLTDLEEWDIGSWDRRPFVEVKDDLFGSTDPPGGETRDVFRRRVTASLENCIRSSEGLFAIVAHGAVWLMIQEHLGMTPERVANCVPYLFLRNTSGAWKVEELRS